MSEYRQRLALREFLSIFGDSMLLEDLGPTLTCIECESLAKLLEAHDQDATALREGHARQDDEGDMESHVKLKEKLEIEDQLREAEDRKREEDAKGN